MLRQAWVDSLLEHPMTDFFAAPFLCIGHRGACGEAPENTLRSFALAIEQGAHALEFDVHCCDGELVVIHDDTLDRTTSGHGPISARTLASLRTLDAGAGEPIPLLDEVLDLAGELPMNIELKGANTAEPVIGRLRARGADPQQFLLSSFDHDQLAVAQRIGPEFPRGALFYRLRTDPLEAARTLGACAANLHRDTATVDRIATLRAAGLRVLVYTVNDLEQARALAAAGASGVFTDHPGRLRTAMLASPADWQPAISVVPDPQALDAD